MLSLALGSEPPGDPCVNWRLVLDRSRAERTAMLAWLRSGALIRRLAPQEVASEWRRLALAAESRVHRQLAALRSVLEAMSAEGIDVCVLKGAPLSVHAYGDVRARVCTDLDLFVPSASRRRARERLERLGWMIRYGTAPWDETYERGEGQDREFLELHSQLLHDSLAHLRLDEARLATELVDVDGMAVPMPAGPVHAIFLAAHAAIHATPAMIWFMDLEAVWCGMSDDDRREALRLARRSGLHRYLHWGLARARALRPAAAGSRTSLRLLGFDRTGERRDHPFVRAVTLAPSLVASARVTGAWLWPRPLRDDRRATTALVLGRGARLLGRHTMAVTGHDPGMRDSTASTRSAAPGRPISMNRPHFVELVREAANARAHVWVRVRGASMVPAIPAGSSVRLGPLPERSLRRGDVVLALTTSGQPVLHRIRSVDGDRVITKGDALPQPDSPLDLRAVIAMADIVRVRTGDDDARETERRIPRRGALPWRRLGAWWWHRLSWSRALHR